MSRNKGHENAPLQGDGAKNKNGKMPGDSPGNPQLIKNKWGVLVPGYFIMPGQNSFYNSVCDSKTGVFPFLTGLANYRQLAAVKLRALHKGDFVL